MKSDQNPENEQITIYLTDNQLIVGQMSG